MAATASAAPSLAPLHRDGPSVLAPRAARSLLLDIAAAGDRFFAVGERGHILVSADDGRSWTQVLAPTRATLTGVTFVTPRFGWIVGHDAVLLRTIDGGRTWTLHFRGPDIEAALFDVEFATDGRHGFAAGAFGQLLRTIDGGNTWFNQPLSEDGLHLYRVSRGLSPGQIWIAGESGQMWRSDDAGQNFRQLHGNYHGSFYGLLPVTDQFVLAYGLRGNVWRSADGGVSWQQVGVPITTLVTSGLRTRTGLVILAGMNGHVLLSEDRGVSFSLWDPPLLGGVADLIEASDGAIIFVGEKGVQRHALPAAQ